MASRLATDLVASDGAGNTTAQGTQHATLTGRAIFLRAVVRVALVVLLILAVALLSGALLPIALLAVALLTVALLLLVLGCSGVVGSCLALSLALTLVISLALVVSLALVIWRGVSLGIAPILRVAALGVVVVVVLSHRGCCGKEGVVGVTVKELYRPRPTPRRRSWPDSLYTHGRQLRMGSSGAPLWLCSSVCLHTPETTPHSAGHYRSSSRATALGSTNGPLGHIQATLGAWVDPSCFRSLVMVGTAARIKA